MSPEPDPEQVPEPLPLVPVPADLARELNPFTRQRDEPVDPADVFRVGELSRRSGVPVGTIKFYLREGLLPSGEATAKTQALYNGEHLRRLRVIRVLSEVGGLTIAQIREVVEVLEDDDVEAGGVSQAVGYAVAATGHAGVSRRGKPLAGQSEAALEAARASTDEFLAAIGLVADDEHPARGQLAEAYAALLALGVDVHPIIFTEHARLAYELARFEVGTMDFGLGGDGTGERQTVDEQVVGTVVFGAAFMALRSLAHEHEVRRLLAAADSPPPPTPPAP